MKGKISCLNVSGGALQFFISRDHDNLLVYMLAIITTWDIFNGHVFQLPRGTLAEVCLSFAISYHATFLLKLKISDFKK